MKKWIIFLTLVTALLLTACAPEQAQPAETAATTVETAQERVSGNESLAGFELLSVENGELRHQAIEGKNAGEWLEKQEKPVFLDFWAEWCGPCRMAAPFVETLAKEYDGKVLVVKVNVDEADADFISQFGMQGIPYFSVLVKGEEKRNVTGYAEQLEPDIRKLLDDLLAS